jgi:hypothetical protein
MDNSTPSTRAAPEDAAPDLSEDFLWKELSWWHSYKIHRFFKAVLDAKQKSLAKEDGKVWGALGRAERQKYHKEAHSVFELRSSPLGVHHVLPLVAALAVPDIVRLCQPYEEMGSGLAGRCHIGLLWHKASDEVVGITIFGRTECPNEAEVSYWKHPSLTGALFRQAMKKLLSRACRAAGYVRLKAHVEAPTREQRGNNASLSFAKKLGFQITGIREPDAPNGNGKKTLVLTTRALT